MNQNQQESKETRRIFEGISFKYPPVSKEEYEQAYEEYVKRCSPEIPMYERQFPFTRNPI